MAAAQLWATALPRWEGRNPSFPAGSGAEKEVGAL